MRINPGYSYYPTTNHAKPQAQTRQNNVHSPAPVLFGSIGYPANIIMAISIPSLVTSVLGLIVYLSRRKSAQAPTNSPSYYNQPQYDPSYDLEQGGGGYQPPPEGYPPQAHYHNSHYPY